ncbi:MAG TPA: transcription antitermination factor NusB [Clostridiales bacterium]|nr:transcription antitermination factor NusB [Clostridiales bacterium]
MSRRESREKAFMLLYQLEIQKGDEESQIASFIEDREVAELEADYLNLLVHGVREHKAELDSRFTPYLKRWTKDRLPKVDLTILRLAVYEMFFVEEVPMRVAISEAVLLCKKYSSEESRSYINAVLGRLSGEGEDE